MIVRCSVHVGGGYASEESRGLAHGRTCRQNLAVDLEESEFLLHGRTRHGADRMNLWGQIETAEAAARGYSTLLAVCLNNSEGLVNGCTRSVANKSSLQELQ